MSNHTSGAWYGKKASNDSQGLIIDETTGKNIAVAYDVRDTGLLAAAPELLTALQALTSVYDRHATGRIRANAWAQARSAIAKATQS